MTEAWRAFLKGDHETPSSAKPALDIEERGLRDVVCPRCRTAVRLVWQEDYRSDVVATLLIRSCPSGGVYDVLVRCPNCRHEEEL